ncbi:hypothetical protein NPIL_39281 [Nephila pilipes]|uniref:Uncharacterized protein n=1 Tax=Nephila pilipes TaxID=299642 RepID=A0A8X6U5P7_NEPPI|nr:hypothetical protein NPIL_39281 [Nephila pilipes]
MAPRKVYFNFSDKNHLPKIQKLFFDDSEAENNDNPELETQIQVGVKEESDTDASENINESEEYFYIEQINTESNADDYSDKREEQYIALRKHKK